MTNPVDLLGPPLSQQVDVTDPIAKLGPRTAPKPPANPVDALGPGLRGPSALEGMQVTGASQPEPTWTDQHPWLRAAGSVVASTVEDAAAALKFALLSGTNGQMLPRFGKQAVNTDLSKPISTPDYEESYNEFLIRRDAEGDPAAKEELNKVMRGAAFIGSLAPAGIVSRATKGLLGPVMSTVVSEATGGAVYGALMPPGEGETRGSNTIEDAVMFGATGGAIALLGKGLVRLIDSSKNRAAIAARAAEILANNDKEIIAAGANPASIPQGPRTTMQVAAMRQALEELDPNAVDLEQRIREQIDRQIETVPRVDEHVVLPELQQPAPNIDLGVTSREQLDIKAAEAGRSLVLGGTEQELAAAQQARAVEGQQHLDMIRNSLVPGGLDGTKIALIDKAAGKVANELDIVQAASPAVKIAKPTLELTVEKSRAATLPRVAGEPEPSAIRVALDRALAVESPASEAGLSVELSGGPRELAEEDVPGRIVGKRGSGVAGELPGGQGITTSVWEQTKAPWAEQAPLMPPDPVAGPRLNGWQLANKMGDKATDLLEAAARKSLGESGAAPYNVIARMAIGGTGAWLEKLAFTPSDDTDSAVKQGTLGVVGGFLMAAAAWPLMKKWSAEVGFTKRIIQLYNHETLIADAGSKEGAIRYRELLTEARTFATTQRNILEKTFPEEADRRAAMLSVEEGSSAPEWHMLTPEQQQAAGGVRNFNLALGQLLKSEGVLEEYVNNYVKHLMPNETYNAWLADGWRTINTGGGFTQRRRILALRDLEDWAKQRGLPMPSTDLPNLQGLHVQEAYRALANSRIRNTFENLGTLAPLEAQLPQGWRRVAIASREPQMAPDAVAAALENIATSGTSQTGIVNALDTIKSHWMQAIMFWPWEHGLNVLRSSIATAFNPAGMADAWRAVRSADPALVEASKYGLDPYARSDFSKQISESFEKAVQAAAGKGSPTLAWFAKQGSNIAKWNEDILWNKIVPSMRLFAYQTQMNRWVDRTAGEFLPGTPEYVTAARAAADFANTTTGAVPKEFQNPRFARMLRLTMFSPAWSLTRMGITASAAGELSEMIAGRLNPRDAMYLPFKMRQLAIGTAVTWGLSKMMTGEEPEFNENNLKFYAKTNWDNGTGRNVGIDLLGWWQDDFKFFNAPNKWIVGRLNPAITVAGNIIQGRDNLGRQVTLPEQVVNVFKSGGPLPAAVELGARVASGDALPPGELAQRISRILATGNIATLPNSQDVVISKLSKRLLTQQRIPATDDRAFELSRILKSNMMRGQSLINQQVVDYLANRRRSTEAKEPLVNLWESAKDVINDF